MFLSALANKKINVIAGITIGVAMAAICKEICKKKREISQ